MKIKQAIAIITFTISVLLIDTSNMYGSDISPEYRAKQTTKQFNTFLSLPDKTDYNDDFYYRNYLCSFIARNQMPWGKTIPEREFKHFVLPVRVNNENLDTARIVFFNELKDRVKNMTLKDAILEVNHWCHEKVSYRPSDARTSSPLATVKTAYGRCGEESTLLVAALRSVCIPARQVYTPRWAHTDDNHAWVEAWADGKWHFLGACEPEPVLDLGWFNESASRAMLMHTKVFGNYDGPEEVIDQTYCYTEINVTDNYAPTSQVVIEVVNENGKPISDALVEFKLYNYAEFYTVVKQLTDINGKVKLTAGKGDLVVWVTKGNLVAVKKVSWYNSHNEKITLNNSTLPKEFCVDFIPPSANPVIPSVTNNQREENNCRVAAEDSIRQAYEASMPIEKYRGNYKTIERFLNNTNNKQMAIKLLDVISDKDLRDITFEVLKDNEINFTDTTDIYCRYVLCPRVENELLSPYKAFFRNELNGKIHNAVQLTEWVKNNIVIDNTHNPQKLRQQPISSYKNRKTDKLGRAILWVSMARSIGIPSRINEVNSKLEWHDGNLWQEVIFDNRNISTPISKKGKLKLGFKPSELNKDLAYYTHFTLSKIIDGKAQLLTFADNATWQNTFSNAIELDEGDYILTTGNRQSDGSVLASMIHFKINEGCETDIEFKLRTKDVEINTLGTINNLTYYNHNGMSNEKLLPKNGLAIIGLIAPNHEPTNHALRDISTYSRDFDKWNGDITLLVENENSFKRLNRNEFGILPIRTKWGYDIENSIVDEISSSLQLSTHSLPIFIICDKLGKVYFSQQGYTIHLGEQLLKAINSVKNTN